MPEKSRRRFSLPILLVCFFLSGAAGLIDQVVWSKALGLIFGHTAYAVATVLAVFMAGLASGSAWIGRWAEHRNRPVALYGWIELGVAATAAISLAGLAAVRAVYVAAYPYAAGSAAVLLVLRFVGAALVLFLPTFLMGGTLPVLVHGLVRSSSELGTRLSRLYWINTAGAVTGTFAAGFVLLPMLGLRQALGIAVMLNLIAGALALSISRGAAFASSNASPETSLKDATIPPAKQVAEKDAGFDSRAFRHDIAGFPPVVLTHEGLEANSSKNREIDEVPSAPRSRFLLLCFGIVGATAMAYEIGWTRLLSTQLGSSTYAFTLMLGTFLAGIVMGSALFERWSRNHTTTSMTFALTQTFTALAALAFLVFFAHLIEVLPPILRATHESFVGLVAAQFVTTALAMLPTAIVFGFNFPAALLLIAGPASAEGAGIGKAVGRAYASNTLGAIMGALAAGFWLLPRLGSFHLLAATAGINLVLAAMLSAESSARRISKRIVLALNLGLLLATAWIGFSNYFYDPAVASFNTVMYWNLYDRPLTLRENAHLVDVVYFAEGLNATISVAKTDGYVGLRTNGKVDASNHDVTTQLLVGHLGALAHPPRRVLLIGFGSGMTASALTGYSELQRLDIVEIEPAVVGAAPLLEQLNRNVLRDPRVHMTFDDARNYLFTTREHYDLIVSEPSNPWIAGVATLFTREFYQAVQSRLADGGVFVQWVQAYSLYPEDLRMLVATFLSEFHGATLWHGDAPDLILMAPGPPSREILSRAQDLFDRPRVHDDFKQLGMDEAAGLYGFYLLDDAGLRKYSSGARINTDDLTLLEYHAPRSLLAHGLEDINHDAILHEQKTPLPDDFPPNKRDDALSASAATSVKQDDTDGADRFLRALDRRPVTASIAAIRGRAALARADFRTAYRAFDAALAIDPNFVQAVWGRAETDRRFGNNEKARQEFHDILERDPKNLQALQSLKRLDVDFSRWSEADDLQSRIIADDLAADPETKAAAYAELGEILFREGDLDRAYSVMQQCLALDEYNMQTRANLGRLLNGQKKWAEARRNLEFVERYDPDGDAGIYTLLFQIDNALSDSRAAAQAVRFGLRMFPENSDLKRLNSLL